jgi:hypothetical protein
MASYGFAYIAPVAVIFGVSRWMHTRSMQSAKQRIIIAILIPVAWVIGLVASFIGHTFHASAWHSANPKGIITEEDMITLGDYPNVFAGWLLLGWLPVVLGLVLCVRRNRSQQEAQQAAPRNR